VIISSRNPPTNIMKQPLLCPACQSTRTECAPDQPEFTFLSFRALQERRCLDCGHQWEPDAPSWLLVLGVFAALALAALGVMLLIEGERIMMALTVCTAGCIALHGCFIRLLRKRKRG
jgi:hypothetical protein